MPTALTQRFGVLDYEDASALQFPRGLPGFEDRYRFVLVEQEHLSPLVFLQSVECAELCFLALPVQVVDPTYEAEISHDDLEAIGLDPSAEYLCLALLASAENGRLTANLLAPVVINPMTRVAVQSVRPDTRYSHQHPLAEAGMLVIRRRAGEALVIGDDIEVEILETGGSHVKLGIRAPKSVPVARKEIHVVGQQNQAASRTISPLSVDDLLGKLKNPSSSPISAL